MSRKIKPENGELIDIDGEETEFAVEYLNESNGETWTYYAADEAEANLYAQILHGKIVTRKILFTPWADVPK